MNLIFMAVMFFCFASGLVAGFVVGRMSFPVAPEEKDRRTWSQFMFGSKKNG